MFSIIMSAIDVKPGTAGGLMFWVLDTAVGFLLAGKSDKFRSHLCGPSTGRQVGLCKKRL